MTYSLHMVHSADIQYSSQMSCDVSFKSCNASVVKGDLSRTQSGTTQHRDDNDNKKEIMIQHHRVDEGEVKKDGDFVM